MTNPSNAVGTNGAYGGRTSVDALNDVLGTFNGAGVLSGWNVRPDSGMSVLVGGQSGVRDVAVAQDQLGDRTTVNNRLGSPISITLASSSPSTARVDSIVLYVNKPASVSTTTIDNPEACGIIAVNGTTTAPSEATIRSAISADGGTGATAYYVVIANITIPASATVITNSNIQNYSGKLLAGSSLADSTITSGKIDWSAMTNAVQVERTSWASSKTFTLQGACHALIFMSQSWAGFIWHSGGGFDLVSLISPQNAPTMTSSGDSVTLSASSPQTWTIFKDTV